MYYVLENKNLNQQTQKILNEYLLSMKLANKNKKTIKEQRRVLELLFLSIKKSLEQITSNDILDYIRNNFANLKEITINGYISIISNFFKYCLEECYIQNHLVKNRWKLKPPKAVPRYLDKTELAKVKIEAEKLSLRDKTIFYFLLSSGCRSCEVHRLNINDINIKNRTATVKGKRNKIRQVHFNDSCAILLEKYIESHPENIEALFLSKYNSRLSKQRIQHIIRDLGIKANLSRKIGAHCIRHTFATVLLSKGSSLEYIAEELGHENITTTRIYARLPEEQIVNLYRRFMG